MVSQSSGAFIAAAQQVFTPNVQEQIDWQTTKLIRPNIWAAARS
jgi:hypothetical protein